MCQDVSNLIGVENVMSLSALLLVYAQQLQMIPEVQVMIHFE